MERSTPTSRIRWGGLFHWPLFCTLAVVHLALLPLVGEREDQVVVVAGGVAYLLLAALDRWWHRRPAPSG